MNKSLTGIVRQRQIRNDQHQNNAGTDANDFLLLGHMDSFDKFSGKKDKHFL